MGRSKFPGKPTKHVNRKRVNVLCTTFGTTVGDINAVVTVETDNSKKVQAGANVGIQQTTKVSSGSDLKVDKKISKKKRRLVRKRANVKRTGMLSTVSNKLTGINQVARRTRSAVTGRRSIRSFSTIRKVSKPKHSLNSTKEPSNLVGKFVLPSRSVHSSRVIKPNKRFINVETNEARTFKKCIVNKRLSVQRKEGRCKAESDNNVKQCLGDGNSRNDRDSRENSPGRVLHSNGKVVLRQARLQLHTQSATGPEGPFSCNSSNNVSPPGTVTCGVCGAVRFYRFVKQARKFNIYSCESCRKFISKMIKRQSNMNSNNVPTLVCQKGQGMCHVPPIVRSQHWKLFRCAYRARCPACWLKMCLRSFQMPISLKNSLAQLLPKNMQSYDLLFSSPLPLLSWQGSIEKKSDLKSEEPPAGQPVRRRPVRFKAAKRDEKPASPMHTPEIKRQKVDLKGPRVKHVCRSASIVLGQPIATFPGELNKKNADVAEEKAADSEKVLNNKDTSFTKTIDGSDKVEDLPQTNVNNSSDFKQTSLHKNSMTKSELSGKKERTSKNASFPNSTAFDDSLLQTKKKLREQGKTVAIDFWENYNPDEVCRNGFGLISSEPFSVEAICFLCGSAGQEILLHCLICCEPYHPYCLEQIPYNFTKHNGKYSWLCPRCTTCTACGEAYRQKINCQKCHKAYHPQCFNSIGKHEDKPMVCSNCLRCKHCDTTNITKFIGNLALCLACFKLRNKENVCPVCQKSPNDNDFDAKLMECRKCKKWVHAKCESLTDEQYQILSLLPYSVEYFCKQCSDVASPHWLEIVQNELRSNILNVLRLLAKNRIARNILKLTPYREFTTKAQVSFKKANVRDEEAGPFESCNIDRDVENRGIGRQFNLESHDGGLDSSKYESKLPVLPTMVEIRKRLNSNQYISLHEFNTCMEQAISKTESEELLKIYRGILKKIFPWYDQALWKENNIANNSLKEANDIYSDLDSIIVSDKDGKVDTRACGFCKGIGDGLAHKESRLLYCGLNEWVHANCAFWSSEVYEEIDGSLQNVHAALNRSKSVKCILCKQKGASIGCCFKGCHDSYHFACAQNTYCYFLHDKTVYCQAHNLENELNLLTSPSDFHILRSLYVESDRKKKKYSEPDKVHFMVGCLSVTNLGKVVPVISDDFEALIPSGFLCSRLFWSTTEPWKLVRYNISTSTLNSEIGNVQVDKNFTVDHSFPKATVEKQLKEILMWQKDICKDTVDSEFDEEPQSTTDILSPELTDAIFEELPHGFLDGISVQDMFMNYEELLNMDFKSEINSNDSMSLNMNSEPVKKAEDEAEMDLKCYRELKRSKSEVFNQLGTVDKLNKSRSHQRSCSLTWSCKLDNSLTPVMKKRKITSRDNNMYLQLLQVDGACDSSSGSDSEGPMNEGDVFLTMDSSEEPVSCERCQCTYRTRASYKRHLETCDALSTSESDSEEESVLTNGNFIKTDNPSILVTVTEPSESNLITSYETFSSYQASQNEMHATILNTQTIMSAEATTEMITVPENSNIFPFQQPLEPKTTSMPVIPSNITISSVDSLPVRHPSLTINQAQTQLSDPTQSTNTYTINQTQISTNQQPTFCVNQQPICLNQSNALLNPTGLISLDNSSLALNQTIPISINPITLNQTAPISLNPTVEIQQPVTLQSIPFTSEVTPILNITPHSQITIDTKMLTTPCHNIVNTVAAQAVNVPQNQWVKPVVKPTVLSHKTIRPRGRPRSLLAKRSRVHTGIVMSQPNSVGPSVIVQHLPSANMMPAFVDAFQQQTGQNLQYVATITPQMAPQAQLVQLQPNSNILSLVPGVQPTMIIQQPRVITDQLIVDGNGSMMWTTQPVHPVYYGFETIVQNTVMQSQQFLPSTMPGVLTTNSSYSATTQVFQTSKLEPVLDVPSGSFVLLNSGQLVNPQTIQIPPQLPQTVSQNVPSASQLPVTHVNNQNQNKTKWEPIEQMTVGEILTQPKPPAPPTSTVSNNMHSISLPLAPFVSEQGIPTNIVTPTPKPPASIQTRPMSRVLPMQTNACRELKKTIEEKIIDEKEVDPCEKDNLTTTLAKINILENISLKPSEEIIFDKQDHPPEEIAKLENNQQKLVSLQKQKQEWRMDNISNTSKVISPVQIAPLKPIKPAISDAMEEKAEIKIAETCPPYHAKQEILETETKLIHQEKITNKNMPSILYTVETHEGFRYTSTSIYELWSKVFEAVQGARAAHSMAPLPANALDTINNLQLLGLKTNGLRYLLEQLPGASKCTKYKPAYHTQTAQDDSDDDIDLNSSSFGAIRSIPYVRKKEPTDMFGWLASKHRKPENSLIDSDLLPRRGGSITNLPMAMRFRQLKLTSKFSVGVYRSGIHRRGLFSLRDIESGEMVIEYAGEVIRSVLTDKREKYYNSKGIGCYMFRIDDNLVVDATMKGNAARFINHSCDPNCYSKVVEIHGHKHIIIFALRRILCGEELTYDYKFPFEEDKIPCTCGARRCRKFLN